MLSWGVLNLGLNWVLVPCACLKTLCPSLDITPRNGLHLRCCSKLLYHVCKLLECAVMFGPKLGCCSKLLYHVCKLLECGVMFGPKLGCCSMLLYHVCKLLEPAVMFGPKLGCCWWLLWGNGMDGWALAGKCLIKQALANTGMSSWLPIYQGGGQGRNWKKTNLGGGWGEKEQDQLCRSVSEHISCFVRLFLQVRKRGRKHSQGTFQFYQTHLETKRCPHIDLENKSLIPKWVVNW